MGFAISWYDSDKPDVDIDLDKPDVPPPASRLSVPCERRALRERRAPRKRLEETRWKEVKEQRSRGAGYEGPYTKARKGAIALAILFDFQCGLNGVYFEDVDMHMIKSSRIWVSRFHGTI